MYISIQNLATISKELCLDEAELKEPNYDLFEELMMDVVRTFGRSLSQC